MTMPAGKYYIGDLCYVMHGEWEEVCGIIIVGHTCKDGEFSLKDGRQFAIYSTANGDGVYYPTTGGECGVDAGSIGCIRVEDIDQGNENVIGLGIVVEFTQPFKTGCLNGVIQFGHVEINTNWEEEEEEEEEEEDDEDDWC